MELVLTTPGVQLENAEQHRSRRVITGGGGVCIGDDDGGREYEAKRRRRLVSKTSVRISRKEK